MSKPNKFMRAIQAELESGRWTHRATPWSPYIYERGGSQIILQPSISSGGIGLLLQRDGREASIIVESGEPAELLLALYRLHELSAPQEEPKPDPLELLSDALEGLGWKPDEPDNVWRRGSCTISALIRDSGKLLLVFHEVDLLSALTIPEPASAIADIEDADRVIEQLIVAAALDVVELMDRDHD